MHSPDGSQWLNGWSHALFYLYKSKNVVTECVQQTMVMKNAAGSLCRSSLFVTPVSPSYPTCLLLVVEAQRTGVNILKHCLCSYPSCTAILLHPAPVSPHPPTSPPPERITSPSPIIQTLFPTDQGVDACTHTFIHTYMHNCTYKYAWTRVGTCHINADINTNECTPMNSEPF